MQYPTTYEEAVAFEAEVEKLVAENRANSKKERSPETLAVLRKIQAVLPAGSRFQHFKATIEPGRENEYYEVLGIEEDVNSGNCYVRYVGNYGSYAGVGGLRILTGEDSFLRPIDRAGYTGVRFRKLS